MNGTHLALGFTAALVAVGSLSRRGSRSVSGDTAAQWLADWAEQSARENGSAPEDEDIDAASLVDDYTWRRDALLVWSNSNNVPEPTDEQAEAIAHAARERLIGWRGLSWWIKGK